MFTHILSSLAASQTPRLVAMEAGLLIAWLKSEDSQSGEISVYTSPLVRASDEPLEGVLDLLRGHVIHAEYVETIKDEAMMFGKAVLIKISMFKDMLNRHNGPIYHEQKREMHTEEIQDALNGGNQRDASPSIPLQRRLSA